VLNDGFPLSITLTGHHVTLTPLALEDVPGLVRAASGDRSTFGWSIVPDTSEDMEVAVRRLLGERDQRCAVPFATRRSDTSEIIGMTRFLTLRWFFAREFPDAAEIGGTFLAATAPANARQYRGEVAHDDPRLRRVGVRRLDLKTDERNERSRRAIERIGGRFEGVLRNWQAAR